MFAAVAGLLASFTSGGGQASAAEKPGGAAAPPRLAVPDSPTQAKAEKVIRDVFGNYMAGSPNERGAMAGKMMEQGLATHDDPAARYMLLKDAADLAAGAGDARTAMRAADLLSAQYVVEAADTKHALLRKAAAIATEPGGAQAVAVEGLACAEQAIEIENYDLAGRFMQPTEQAARNAKNVPFS